MTETPTTQTAPKTPVLDRVTLPSDLKALTDRELHRLADELRAETISAVSVTGGHLGAGLGVVELISPLLFLEILNEEIRAAKKFSDEVFPLPQVVACRYFNDANLLGAVYNFRGQFGSA